MKEILTFDPGYEGWVRRYVPQGRLYWLHRHDEVEINLVIRGTARYLVGERRYDLARHTQVWLFPAQDHLLIDLSPDYEMWMTGDTVNAAHQPSLPKPSSGTDAYDPRARGRHPVGVRTIQALDTQRTRLFPCEIWYPAAARHAGQDLSAATQDVFAELPGAAPRRQMAVRDATALPGHYPLILFSHSSGGRRRQSTFLCTHLSSHGYVVAALDHSEVLAPDLRGHTGETAAQQAARVDAWIANRVPDIRFLLDRLLDGAAWAAEMTLDWGSIGIVGHSFGGWTALAAPEVESRIGAVVALAPAGSSQPPPGIIPAQLTFAWGRDVPTLYLVAEDDTVLPLVGMSELLARTRATKRMVIVRRADHEHFADVVVPRQGQCSRDEAHLVVRGLTLGHLDAVLRHQEAAQRLWEGDLVAALDTWGVDVLVARP